MSRSQLTATDRCPPDRSWPSVSWRLSAILFLLAVLPRLVVVVVVPDRWLEAHPQHRWTIADVRDKERQAKGGL